MSSGLCGRCGFLQKSGFFFDFSKLGFQVSFCMVLLLGLCGFCVSRVGLCGFLEWVLVVVSDTDSLMVKKGLDRLFYE